MENGNNNTKVCVTGASGYIGSWLIKKLLEKGYIVHATLRNLGEESKTTLLKSLPMAETRLKLFQADIYNAQEFEAAIQGCQYVVHVATPLFHTQNSTYKDTTEAAIAGIRSIAESCLRSSTVKRLVYTSSVTAASPLREDSSGYKPQMDELCWTPLNLSSSYANDFLLVYMLMEILSYNNLCTGNGGKLEVVSLVCGLVGGETLLPYLSSSLPTVLAQLKGDQIAVNVLRFLQDLLGSIPLIHIEDVCEAHIFCIEKNILCGRFLCAADSCTTQDMANCYQQIHPQFQIAEGLKSGPKGRSKCELSKLRKEGYEFKYGLKDILNDSVECGKRMGYL
ncbi:dihydroflavonol-4-reductase [Phtheirospermum japonicum]|uniref:Dihydroflavonol-4-reductase n=1 Tax=Phtheirospermum japonicum TaxID=374723 RepID=A0A830BF17_9LAMI|nr:dihydroflavonol-4-reductase [Phtheirospermum japonicum]